MNEDLVELDERLVAAKNAIDDAWSEVTRWRDGWHSQRNEILQWKAKAETAAAHIEAQAARLKELQYLAADLYGAYSAHAKPRADIQRDYDRLVANADTADAMRGGAE